MVSDEEKRQCRSATAYIEELYRLYTAGFIDFSTFEDLISAYKQLDGMPSAAVNIIEQQQCQYRLQHLRTANVTALGQQLVVAKVIKVHVLHPKTTQPTATVANHQATTGPTPAQTPAVPGTDTLLTDLLGVAGGIPATQGNTATDNAATSPTPAIRAAEAVHTTGETAAGAGVQNTTTGGGTTLTHATVITGDAAAGTREQEPSVLNDVTNTVQKQPPSANTMKPTEEDLLDFGESEDEIENADTAAELGGGSGMEIDAQGTTTAEAGTAQALNAQGGRSSGSSGGLFAKNGAARKLYMVSDAGVTRLNVYIKLQVWLWIVFARSCAHAATRHSLS